MRSEITEYGFNFGSLTVERACSHKGTAMLNIKTPKGIIQIQASPSGKTYISVWSALMENRFKLVAKISSKYAGWKLGGL
jgi:hypothetical protein